MRTRSHLRTHMCVLSLLYAEALCVHFPPFHSFKRHFKRCPQGFSNILITLLLHMCQSPSHPTFPFADSELQEMIERADTNGDGKVTAEDFYAIMTRSTLG